MSRGGLVDAVLVVGVVVLAATQTPVGAVATWGVDRMRGHHRDMPDVLAHFHTARPAPTLPADLAPLLVDRPTVLPGSLAAAVEHVVLDSGPPRRFADATAALAALEADWTRHPDAPLARWALGDEAVDRAARRALAAGGGDPGQWETLRKWMPAHHAAEGDRLVSGPHALATVLQLTWPIAGPHRVSSNYGWRDHPVLSKRKFHDGIDLAVPVGTPVGAAQQGVVAVVGENGVSGRFVVVDHDHGVRSSYCHLDRVDVARGDVVSAGQIVALSGNTGRSTGPHLHFGLRLGGETLDPAPLRHGSGDTVGAAR
ncbi:MAG: murein DD-endopeptidase MepM/ murein hydrolase activator NlpD [Myxococcota bacterium]